MLERLLPSATDCTYQGSRIALWLLGLILFLKLGIAFGAIFNGHYAATVADGIPIDSYTPQGSQAVLALFGALGISQVMLCVLGVFVLFRYQSLVPIFLLVLLVEYLARKGVTVFLPIVRSGSAPGGVINWAVFGIMVVAFVLSLRRGVASFGNTRPPP